MNDNLYLLGSAGTGKTTLLSKLADEDYKIVDVGRLFKSITYLLLNEKVRVVSIQIFQI